MGIKFPSYSLRAIPLDSNKWKVWKNLSEFSEFGFWAGRWRTLWQRLLLVKLCSHASVLHVWVKLPTSSIQHKGVRLKICWLGIRIMWVKLPTSSIQHKGVRLKICWLGIRIMWVKLPTSSIQHKGVRLKICWLGIRIMWVKLPTSSIQHKGVRLKICWLGIRIMWVKLPTSSIQHKGVRLKICWLGIRIMCLEWSHMSTHEMLFQWTSTIKLQLNVLV